MFTSSKKTGKLKVEFRVPSLSRLHGWDNFNRAQLNDPWRIWRAVVTLVMAADCGGVQVT